MAFIPGYNHDIFVSYAHVDNDPFGREQPEGWVATLVRLLKKLLDQRFGRPDHCSVWFDTNNLRGNDTVTDEVAARVQRAALFIAILSPGFIKSRWCQDEARLFSLMPGDLKRRVFVVETEPRGEDIPVPPVLAGRRAYQFWYRGPNNQPRILARWALPRDDEHDYFRQVEDLARDLHDRCLVMRDGLAWEPTATPMETASVVPAAARPAVLLADVTDDLEFKRAEVQRYLEAHGVLVLPERTYPLGLADISHSPRVRCGRGPVNPVETIGRVPARPNPPTRPGGGQN